MYYRWGPPLAVQNGGLRMRIGENARRCVLFFGVPSSTGIQYGGTGFLVRVMTEGGLHARYLVTARHVAEALNKYEDTGFYIRMNLKGGGSESFHVETARWLSPSDRSIDVAVTPFGVDVETRDHIHLPLPDILADFSSPSGIRCGDVINIIGLFRLHAGSKRNVPLVHNGHISLLPDTSERVPVRDRTTGELVESEVFLVEAQTLDGLSGSPVFIHDIVELDADRPVDKHGTYPKMFGTVRLLGLYQGSWDGEPGAILAKDRDLRGNVRVPIGMGAVVPANKISELILNDPGLKAQRTALAQEILARRAASTDSAIPDPPASDANLTHREDFTRLLGAAVKAPQSKD